MQFLRGAAVGWTSGLSSAQQMQYDDYIFILYNQEFFLYIFSQLVASEGIVP